MVDTYWCHQDVITWRDSGHSVEAACVVSTERSLPYVADGQLEESTRDTDGGTIDV